MLNFDVFTVAQRMERLSLRSGCDKNMSVQIEGNDSCEIQNTAELFNMPAISPCVASATLAV